jgi:NAD(P)-dependent dehydrogenase (short-subunit alcohol dehydrogenase family)
MMMSFKAGDSIPLKRGGTTEDVAITSLDMSGYITGQVLNVDGECLLKK